MYGPQPGDEPDNGSDYEFPPVSKEIERQMRRARFSTPSAPGVGAQGHLPYGGTSSDGVYGERVGSPSVMAAGDQGYHRLNEQQHQAHQQQPYHETVNPLANVYQDGAGLESWC